MFMYLPDLCIFQNRHYYYYYYYYYYYFPLIFYLIHYFMGSSYFMNYFFLEKNRWNTEVIATNHVAIESKTNEIIIIIIRTSEDTEIRYRHKHSCKL